MTPIYNKFIYFWHRMPEKSVTPAETVFNPDVAPTINAEEVYKETG